MSDKNRTSLVKTLAGNQLMKDDTFWDILRSTVVPQEFSDKQTMVFLATANALNLNPLNGEIYPAIMDGRVSSLVGIDGWLRRANDHPMMDGMEVDMSEDGSECTVTIHRKDRGHPIRITEYLSECKKNTRPWNSHPKRMLRHRTIIQGVRIAFGSEGAVDADDKHYFEADAQVIDTEIGGTDLTGRLGNLSDAIGEAVGEPEPPLFQSVEKTSCNHEGCRKRLVRFCEECGRHFCVDHYEIDHDKCISCHHEGPPEPDQGEGIESGEEKPGPNHEPDPDLDHVAHPPGSAKEAVKSPSVARYPQNPGKDPREMNQTKEEELPWD